MGFGFGMLSGGGGGGGGAPSTAKESDWTYLVVNADFTTGAAADVFSFTPDPNSYYEIEGEFLIQASDTSNVPQPGAAWGTGYLLGGATVRVPVSAQADAAAYASIGPAAGSFFAPNGALATANVPYLSMMRCFFQTGAAPTPFTLRLRSETATANVTLKAGSFLRYRTLDI